MKVTISVIKADIGSIGGHICPSQRLVETVRAHVREHAESFFLIPTSVTPAMTLPS
jgi:fructose 1,6-bisphosphate aldolase/phosphatase